MHTSINSYFFDSNWNLFFSSNLLNLSFPPDSSSSCPTTKEIQSTQNNNKNCKDGVIECECMLTNDLKVTIDGDNY